jgi:hypothetical protein
MQKKGLCLQNVYIKVYDESFINNLINHMTEINKGREKANLEQILLILDDCISDVRLHDSKAFQTIIHTWSSFGYKV